MNRIGSLDLVRAINLRNKILIAILFCVPILSEIYQRPTERLHINQFRSVLQNRYICFIALICPMGRATIFSWVFKTTTIITYEGIAHWQSCNVPNRYVISIWKRALCVSVTVLVQSDTVGRV